MAITAISVTTAVLDGRCSPKGLAQRCQVHGDRHVPFREPIVVKVPPFVAANSTVRSTAICSTGRSAGQTRAQPASPGRWSMRQYDMAQGIHDSRSPLFRDRACEPITGQEPCWIFAQMMVASRAEVGMRSSTWQRGESCRARLVFPSQCGSMGVPIWCQG